MISNKQTSPTPPPDGLAEKILRECVTYSPAQVAVLLNVPRVYVYHIKTYYRDYLRQLKDKKPP